MIPAFFRRPGPAFLAGLFIGWCWFGDGIPTIQSYASRFGIGHSGGYDRGGYQPGNYRSSPRGYGREGF